MEKAIVIDIDGTIADDREIRHLYESHGAGADPVRKKIPDLPVIDFMRNIVIRNFGHCAVLFLTARKSFFYGETANWISKHFRVMPLRAGLEDDFSDFNSSYFGLCMQDPKDPRQAHEYKLSKLILLSRHMDVDFVVDDNEKNCTTFSDCGYHVLRPYLPKVIPDK